MSLLNTLIRKNIKQAGGQGKAITEAQIWYTKAKQDSKDKTLVKTNERFKRGKIYMFNYNEPKSIKRLKSWDAHPVVLSLGQNEYGNDIGINLNLLPNPLRLRVMDKVMEAYVTNIKTAIRGRNKSNAKSQQQLISLTYDNIVKVLSRIGFSYAIRTYINGRKSNQYVLSYDSWPKVIYLNIAEINKGLK